MNQKADGHCEHAVILTRQHLNHHWHLLLDDVLVGEAGITAVIGSRVIELDVREIQISVYSHGYPAVRPHRVHGGDSCLNRPVKRPCVGA